MGKTLTGQYASTGDNVNRPFAPADGADASTRIATALEFIATALARIDHNVELAVNRMPKK